MSLADITPPYSSSSLIRGVHLDRFRYHHAVGDMWPLTWANDGHLYGGAGDNRDSPMNIWRVTGEPRLGDKTHVIDWYLDLVDNCPLDPAIYCNHPRVDKVRGLKPASMLDIDGTLHLAVQSHNYGSDPAFNRQTNIEGWIITSTDYGRSWKRDATDQRKFFSGRVASCHFLQAGRGAVAVDGWLYAYFPGASDDGNSYWCNGDYVLLGRVRAADVLDRSAWSFCASAEPGGVPTWTPDDGRAVPIFAYPRMTGENHVSYNPGLGRYIMGNYSFIDDDLRPVPYHQDWPATSMRSQLTLFEAPQPWGPWSLFHRDDDWGTYGDYQPSFPVKWIYNEGRTMFMVSSGSYDDYNFTVQRIDLEV